MHDDDKAQAVLDGLAGIPRCPSCGTVSEWPWHIMDRQEVAICSNATSACLVVYFRRNGGRLYLGDPQDEDGTWVWSYT